MFDSMKQLTIPFDGDPILFFVSPNDAMIGMKSVVRGMGLTWAAQYRKIKNDLPCCFKAIPLPESCENKAIAIQKKFIPDYLDSINLQRIPGRAKKKVQIYKRRFPDFVNEHTLTQSDLDSFDTYISIDDNGNVSKTGIQRLVNDMIRMDYKEGIKRVTEVLFKLMSNAHLNEGQLLLSDEIYEIAEYLSKNQYKLRGAA